MGLAAPLGDFIFEPALAVDGRLTPYLSWLVGSGPGAGYALLIFLAAIGMASVGGIGYLIPSLRHVEAREPDHDGLSIVGNR
jgi:hypothetical protein